MLAYGLAYRFPYSSPKSSLTESSLLGRVYGKARFDIWFPLPTTRARVFFFARIYMLWTHDITKPPVVLNCLSFRQAYICLSLIHKVKVQRAEYTFSLHTGFDLVDNGMLKEKPTQPSVWFQRMKKNKKSKQEKLEENRTICSRVMNFESFSKSLLWGTLSW